MSDQRSAQLRNLLNDWDPIGIRADDSPPDDEYDELIGPLLRRLEAGETASDIAGFLQVQLREHFGLDPERSRPNLFAERVVASFRTQSSST